MRKSLLWIACVALILSIVSLSGCKKLPDHSTTIITTTPFLADAVNQIASPHLQAIPLIKPGLDPHQYMATPGDVRKLISAKGVICHGLHLEAKMGDIIGKLPNNPFIVGDHVPPDLLLVSPDTAGLPDPHIWFSPKVWGVVLRLITNYLKEIDPAHASDFETNLNQYLIQLSMVDENNQKKIATIPTQNRILVTSHDAFQYFGRYYGFRVIGLQGTSTLSEPNSRDIDQLATLIIKHGIQAIFIESSVPARNLQAVQAAVRAKGGRVKIGHALYSDSTGSAHTPEGTYLGVLQANVDYIVDGLGE